MLALFPLLAAKRQSLLNRWNFLTTRAMADRGSVP
jgi:hypothetical protein